MAFFDIDENPDGRGAGPHDCYEFWDDDDDDGESDYYICKKWGNDVYSYTCECVLDEGNLEDLEQATDEDGKAIEGN